jgi:hypothetical protein
MPAKRVAQGSHDAEEEAPLDVALGTPLKERTHMSDDDWFLPNHLPITRQIPFAGGPAESTLRRILRRPRTRNVSRTAPRRPRATGHPSPRACRPGARRSRRGLPSGVARSARSLCLLRLFRRDTASNQNAANSRVVPQRGRHAAKAAGNSRPFAEQKAAVGGPFAAPAASMPVRIPSARFRPQNGQRFGDKRHEQLIVHSDACIDWRQ